MGYNTEFDGVISIDPSLPQETVSAINSFCKERHDSPGFPSIWCDLEVSENGDELFWNGSEKTYELDGWVKYIIDEFINPTGSVVSGTIEAQGEEGNDRWDIVVVCNRVYRQDYTLEKAGMVFVE